MRYFYTSMTRISDLETKPFEVQSLPKNQWHTGDYVVGKITSLNGKHPFIELPNGRMMEVMQDDLVIGAFGVRQATLEAVGSWQDIPEDGSMEALTEGGLFGKATSVSFMLDNLPTMVYQGHVMRHGQKVCLKDFVPNLVLVKYNCPTIMMIGTSMSSGKTTTGRVIIHELKKRGLKIVGAKFAGAGQYHDILSMQDAGADAVFDFVDVGLPSSICPAETYRLSLRKLLSLIAREKPDVVVAEAGASPFEPYNGSIVLEEIKEQICCTVMCASDAYAILGVIRAFGLTPDLVSGIVTDTTAGVELVEKLTGIKALTLPSSQSMTKLWEILRHKLNLGGKDVD
jgi:molybdopterin-guanine dinucleotide biosynthesis protein